MTVRHARRIARIYVAGVWLDQGFRRKVLNQDPSHTEIIGSIPGVPADQTRSLAVGWGLAESVLALWILSGRHRRKAAVIQTTAIVGMNAGGLLLARDHIKNPRSLLIRNAALVGLIWCVASGDD